MVTVAIALPTALLPSVRIPVLAEPMPGPDWVKLHCDPIEPLDQSSDSCVDVLEMLTI